MEDNWELIERKARAFDWLCSNCEVFDVSNAPGLKVIPWVIEASLEAVEAAAEEQAK